MKYKVEVIADSSGKWCANGLRFDTYEEGETYAKDLSWRWTGVREWRVVPAEEDAKDQPSSQPIQPVLS